MAGVEGIHARPPSRGPSPVTRRVTRLAAPAAAVGERGFNAHMDASLSAEALELVASLAAQQAATAGERSLSRSLSTSREEHAPDCAVFHSEGTDSEFETLGLGIGWLRLTEPVSGRR